MNTFLTVLIRAINLTKSHRLMFRFTAGALAAAALILSVISLGNDGRSLASSQNTGQTPASSAGLITGDQPVLSPEAKAEQAKSKAARDSKDSKPAAKPGDPDTAAKAQPDNGQIDTGSTKTPGATQPAGGKPAANPKTSDSDAGFSLALNEAAVSSDEATGTISIPYVITRDSGYSLSLTATTETMGSGTACKLVDGNLEITAAPDAAAGSAGCRLVVSDGKASRSLKYYPVSQPTTSNQ